MDFNDLHRPARLSQDDINRLCYFARPCRATAGRWGLGRSVLQQVLRQALSLTSLSDTGGLKVRGSAPSKQLGFYRPM
jgi:hypothetical protein